LAISVFRARGASVVLLVEDNPDMNAFIAGALSAEGYRVVCAFDGQEGLEKALATEPQ
jgi:DNA-binding response OmpR family regulator